MWTRGELKTNAKAQLKTNYWGAVLVGIILTFLTTSAASTAGRAANNENGGSGLDMSGWSVSMIAAGIAVAGTAIALGLLVNLLLTIFLWNPLEVGCQKFFINCKYEKAGIKDVIFAIKRGYSNVGKVMFVRTICTYLWTLLFIIPGIVKSYEYMMIPYLLAEDPQMSRQDAFARSKEMMNGNKWNAFVLDLSFIGWMLLGAITCGLVGVFYVNPYRYMTRAELYQTLKNQ